MWKLKIGMSETRQYGVRTLKLRDIGDFLRHLMATSRFGFNGEGIYSSAFYANLHVCFTRPTSNMTANRSLILGQSVRAMLHAALQ